MGKKITQLATITEVADDDLIVGVDVSDTSGSENGTNKKFTKATLLDGLAPLNPQLTGWNPDTETWVYHNVDDPTGYIKIEDKDVSANYSVGWRIMFTNGGNVIKGIITAITYSDPDTIITFLHEIDPTDNQALYLLANSAITENYVSPHKAPLGFPVDPRRWSIEKIISSEITLNGITNGVVYNFTNVSITKPFGLFRAIVDISNVGVELQTNTTNTPLFEVQLSESSNSMTGEFSRKLFQINIGYFTAQTTQRYDTLYFEKQVIKEDKQTYYLNIIVNRANPGGGNINLKLCSLDSVSRIIFISEYL